jgi:hypothetical protein
MREVILSEVNHFIKNVDELAVEKVHKRGAFSRI